MNKVGPATGSGERQGGFTIIETLIVLAVSGALLMGAVLLVAGQQRKVEFSQAAQDIRSVAEQMITETSSGYYPNAGNIRCVAGASGPNISQVAGTQQGTNTGCIFMGKAIQFGNSGDRSQYVMHTVAALRTNDGTLSSARPRAVDFDSARVRGQLRNGLTVHSMRYVSGGTANDISTVVFASGLGSYSDSQLLSGTQSMTLLPVPASGTVATVNTTAAASAISGQLDDSAPQNPDGGVLICFNSGGTGKSALLTIGSNNRKLSVTLDFKNTVDCT